MKNKKIYEAPALKFYHVQIPSILAGTISGGQTDVTEYNDNGGYADPGEEGLSRRGGGFWDDDF